MLKLTIASSLIFLAACGGSSNGVGVDEPDFDTQFPIFEEARNLEPFDPRGLQTNGTAEFNGNMGIFLENDAATIGEVTWSVNFQNNSFEGSAFDFVDSNSNEYDGSLAITEGIIDRNGNFNSDYSATSLLNGTLVSPARTIAVDGFIVGDFSGDDGEFYNGFLRIGLDGEEFQDGDDFGGIVAARRN